MKARAMLREGLRFALMAVPGLLCCLSMAGTMAPQHIQQEIPQARIAGQGTFSWFGLKIYDATFWVGDNGFKPAAPAAGKFVLDLQYAWDLQGAKIADASVKEIEAIGIGSAQQRQAWLANMKSIFPDVKDGTRISGVYLPEQGARFYLDGKLLGEILDPEFGRAFFAIWLDPKTSDKKLRSALLADAAPR